MTTAFYLAAEDGEPAIQVGHYTKFELFGLTFNLETIIATALAALIIEDRCPGEAIASQGIERVIERLRRIEVRLRRAHRRPYSPLRPFSMRKPRQIAPGEDTDDHTRSINDRRAGKIGVRQASGSGIQGMIRAQR